MQGQIETIGFDLWIEAVREDLITMITEKEAEDVWQDEWINNEK